MNQYRINQLIDKIQKMEVANMSKEEIQKSFTKDEMDILKVAMLKVEKSEEVDVEKGGEGSRGGKIIGHTKSGKPIYGSFNHPEHKNFNSADHRDASIAHSDAIKIYQNKLGGKNRHLSEDEEIEYRYHKDQAYRHNNAVYRRQNDGSFKG